VVVGLIPAVLAVETGLPEHAEGDAGDSGADGSPRYGGPDLRDCDGPERLREQYHTRSEHRAQATDRHEPLFVIAAIDPSSGWGGHEYASNTADSHDRTDPPALPSMGQQENAKERANLRLHVRHEKVEGLDRALAAPEGR
jgi:hypothetical protein